MKNNPFKGKNKRRKNLKVWSSVFLSLLMISGGVLAMPTSNPSSFSPSQLQESINLLERSPEKFLQPQDLGLKPAFQSPEISFNPEIDEQENYYSINEGALEKALRNRDYPAWKEVVKEMGSVTKEMGIIDEEEFNILASLKEDKSQ